MSSGPAIGAGRTVAVAAFAVAMGCTIPIGWPMHAVGLHLQPEKPFTTVLASGAQVDVAALELGVSSIELRPCVTDDRRRDLPGFAELLLPSAHAHGIAPSSMVVGPQRVDVLAPAAALAAFDPPSGRYCAVVLELGPDERHPSLSVRGRYDGGQTAGEELDWATDVRATVELALDPPLELGNRSVEAAFAIRTNPAAWFADVDDTTDPDAAAARLLEGLVDVVELVR